MGLSLSSFSGFEEWIVLRGLVTLLPVCYSEQDPDKPCTQKSESDEQKKMRMMMMRRSSRMTAAMLTSMVARRLVTKNDDYNAANTHSTNSINITADNDNTSHEQAQ